MEEKMEEKIESNARRLEENVNKMKEDMLEHSRRLEEKLLENTEHLRKEVEEKLLETATKLREEMDEKLKVFEDQVKQLEKQRSSANAEVSTIKRTSESASQAVNQTAVGKTELPTFDGKTPLEEYLTLFETAAMINGWSENAKASTLCLALRGDALKVLQAIPLAERQNYNELTQQLQIRFGHKHMEQVYRSQLKNRYQKPNESLQEFEADIVRLIRCAYPTVPDDVCESLAIDKFLDGLRESETQQAVKLARPRTLNEALTQALEFEAVKQSVRGHARVRELENTEEEKLEKPDSVEEIVKRVLAALKDQKGQLSTRMTDAPKRIARVASLKPLAHSIFISGHVNGKPRDLLLDTGATMSIIRPEVVKKRKILPTRWTLRTATGESAQVIGETVANFRIGDAVFDFKVLVANVQEDVILGMDIMTSFGFKLDLEAGILKVNGEEVILNRRKEFAARVVLAEDVTLKELSETVVQASLDGDVLEEQVVMVEPTVGDECCKGILVAKTINRAGGKFPVRLMNVNTFPVTLKKKTLLGRCSTVSSIIHHARNTSARPRELSQRLKNLVEESCRELSEEQRSAVENLIERYQDVFEDENGTRGRTTVVRHRIDTGDAQPIRQAPRRLPLSKREEAEQIIKEMERDGVIEPSSSPWASPVVLVKKKDGSTRFCVDYRQLNNVTKKDSYPLPRIDDTLDTLVGCKMFSTLDLKSGYWQVGLEPGDKEKTAFTIGTGLWQFTVMAFGLCNAPATFERLMENVLRGLSWETCLVYLDDIIVLGTSFSNHLKNLEQVFQRLRGANLKLNPKKCNLFQKEVSYLGHVVSEKGVSVDPKKIEAIRDWPVPKDKHEVRSFLGLCTYYRRFVSGFANIAKPLTRLTEENRSYVWCSECQKAFEELKKALVSAPILSYPRPDGRFILDTDASNVGIGGVLSQVQDGQEKVIGYFSKVLSKPERNYCVTRRELLAVVKSVEHFHKYVYGRKFLLRTDHAALMWLLRFKNPEGQVARWIERLQEYDFDSEHRSGSRHCNADALSRRPCPEDCAHCIRMEEKSVVRCDRVTLVDEEWNEEEVRADQESDACLKYVLEWKRAGNRPTWEEVAPHTPEVKSYWAQWDSLILEDGILRRILENDVGTNRKLQLIVPKKRIPQVLELLHDGSSGGHLGIRKTLGKVRERFYWVNCKKDVVDWCKKCVTCATANGPPKKRRAAMKQYNVGSPFERIAIDIAGPFPTTDDGNKFILVAMDYFSKWVEAYAIPNQESVTVAEVLVKELFCRFGVPLELHSDQGRNFESTVFQEVCKILGIRKTRTTALHPQSDGMVERMNRTVGKYLSKVVSDHQRDWDQHLPLFLLAYRASIHESTGQTPANVLFCRELRLPCDLKFGFKPNEEVVGEDYVSNLRKQMDEIHDRVRANIHEASDRMKERYDIKAEASGYQPGDLVWLFNPQRRRGLNPKLQRSWDGPYEVVKRINDVIYRIKKRPNGKPKVVHFNRLAPFLGDNHGEEQHVQICKVPEQELEFEEFMSQYGSGRKARYGVTTEVRQDLFNASGEYALAHCVAQDLKMEKGIARVFRQKFGRLEELRRQGPAVGKALHLCIKEKFLFYLVTKKHSNEKPTYRSIWDSLLSLRSHLLQEEIVKLAIPKLDCGADGLNWRIVRNMLEELFRYTGIEIRVCCHNPRGMTSNGRSVACHFFKTSSCRKGPDCRYLHETNYESVSGRNRLKEGAV